MTFRALEVENLGKQYRVGRLIRPANTIRDLIAGQVQEGLKALTRRSDEGDSGADRFWALRGVELAVASGEAVGIIGPNGAGKSTLLKILSRITEPTEGIARVRGRVGSLLEVGTGFHSELTGRENTYMSGAILGMKRAEIDRKFDEIVAFAEIDRFIDTPAKHYSSGMYLRLAFAVAAHLEPDILIVDEVLAVGDADFQRKCLGKMEEVSQREGRAVLFVSHDLAAVQRLCDRSVLLRSGRAVAAGRPSEVIEQYLAGDEAGPRPRSWLPVDNVLRRGTGRCEVEAVWFSGDSADAGFLPWTDGAMEIRLAVVASEHVTTQSIAVFLSDAFGNKLVNIDTVRIDCRIGLQPGRNEVCLHVEALHLNPGRYSLGFRITDDQRQVMDTADAVTYLEVVDPPGPVRPRPRWDGAVSCEFDVWRHD